MKQNILLLAILTILSFSCGEPTDTNTAVDTAPPKTEPVQLDANNVLSADEKAAGWELLFDGKSMDKWRVFKQDKVKGWAINNGEMQALGTGGLNGKGADIITKEQFTDFELSLDWKISPEGNSGIFFNVIETEGLNAVYESGPEYQLIDDIGFPAALEDWQKSAANYGMHTAPTAKTEKVGTFNTSKIIVNKGHVEHWLNGKKVVEYNLWTDEWKKLVQDSKWKDYPAYGLAKSGHIGLQDHGNQIWFRNIKVKRL